MSEIALTVGIGIGAFIAGVAVGIFVLAGKILSFTNEEVRKARAWLDSESNSL
jgi:hypothetical protein